MAGADGLRAEREEPVRRLVEVGVEVAFAVTLPGARRHARTGGSPWAAIFQGGG